MKRQQIQIDEEMEKHIACLKGRFKEDFMFEPSLTVVVKNALRCLVSQASPASTRGRKKKPKYTGQSEG